MNKRIFCLAAFLASLGACACAQAQSYGIEALFAGRGARSLTFYECTGKGGSAKAICRSVNRKKSVTFRRDGMASGNYFDRKKGFTGTWKQSPDSDDVSVTEGPALGVQFSLVDGKYLVYFAEESDDIYPYVLEEKSPARSAGASELIPREAYARQIDAFLAGLVHFKVVGTDVRLRKGAGPQHEVLCKLNESGRSKYDTWSEGVALRKTASGDGRQWYHVLYLLEHQEEDGLVPMDAWICADYVTASSLTPFDRGQIEADRFHVLNVDDSGIGPMGELPSFSFGEPLSLRREPDSDADCVAVPAGTRMKLFGGINSGDRPSVLIWEAIDASRIRQLGWMPLDDLETRSGYAGEQAVRRWLARQRQAR